MSCGQTVISLQSNAVAPSTMLDNSTSQAARFRTYSHQIATRTLIRTLKETTHFECASIADSSRYATPPETRENRSRWSLSVLLGKVRPPYGRRTTRHDWQGRRAHPLLWRERAPQSRRRKKHRHYLRTRQFRRYRLPFRSHLARTVGCRSTNFPNRPGSCRRDHHRRDNRNRHDPDLVSHAGGFSSE